MSSTRGGSTPKRRPSNADEDAASGRARDPVTASGGARWTVLPLALAGTLALMALLPRVQVNPRLATAFWTWAAVLIAWHLALMVRSGAAAAAPRVLVKLRPQHYVQALVQLAVFVYWGRFWGPVYDMGWLIGAQLVFAYAFDMLLGWSRRRSYVLGFGPFPIIFSINLFLWFRDDWFFLQFVMIAVGLLGKEFVRWRREGRSTHIFNPSALSLGLFSVVLIATGTSDLTWGQEIASTLTLAPRIYLFLFLLGLIVMYFFSITLVAASAAAMLFGLSALYAAWSGVPYFVDSEIPAAVFLGLHLLVTDPSTSPRSAIGKAAFGALYGVGVFALYALLGAAGAPTFYDKLLCVPLLNLSVRGIDGGARALAGRWARWRKATGPIGGLSVAATPISRPANLAHMAVWAALFAAMTLLGRTDGRHPGDRVPFWIEACAEQRRNACDRLLQLELTYCGDNSAWACNELGAHYARQDTPSDQELALGFYARACELRLQAACVNLLAPGEFVPAEPTDLDLRLLLREGGLNLLEMPAPDLYGRACEHGWAFACSRVERAS